MRLAVVLILVGVLVPVILWVGWHSEVDSGTLSFGAVAPTVRYPYAGEPVIVEYPRARVQFRYVIVAGLALLGSGIYLAATARRCTSPAVRRIPA